MLVFHPIIQENYVEVHKWLSDSEPRLDYRRNNAWDRVKKQLQKPTFESVALQYYVLFPAHAAKVAFTLGQVVGQNSIAEWLQYNSRVTVIDVGCGSGAASVAFVDCLLKLRENGQISNPICIHFVGVDPNEYAIAVYYQQIERLKTKVEGYDFGITHKIIADSDLRAVNELTEELTRQRKRWAVPFLTHAFLFQANVVSPFGTRFSETESKRQRLVGLGIPTQELSNSQEVFGKEEAIAYRRLLENSGIDNLHIITVGTDGYEQRVGELAAAIGTEFEDNDHVVERANGGDFSVTYSIPDTCYWKEHRGNNEWTFSYCTEVNSISNVALADKDWREIQSIQNLRTAWARARQHLLGQTLVDEVEIRLFESRLDANIARLQQQLVAYAQDVVHSDDRLHFRFPKSDTKLRSLGLSRIEEEILSTALIQKLGQKISGIASRSYAYKFSRTYGEYTNEYLYENWFDAYSRYIADARFAAQNNAECIVIQVDIKSFYTRIIRDSLVQFSNDQLGRSARIEWLLRILFARDIDEHEAGKGIIQGNIASGFFANLYLFDLDARFGPGNEWNVEFFRYVDDIIIVVPDIDDVESVLTELERELDNIGLELNRGKTEIFTDIAEFMSATDKDEKLDELQSQFQDWLNCLWILDAQHWQVFRKAYNESQTEWWYRIELYCECLKAIGISIDIALLSRRIYKYLFNEKLCEKDFAWQEPFQIPTLPDSMEEDQVNGWKKEFERTNRSWENRKAELARTFQELLIESRLQITEAIDKSDTRSEKLCTRTLRFCINKLFQIGFQSTSTAQIILEILRESPWLIRNPHKLIENLAIHGYTKHIQSLLVCFHDETDQMNEYMKSIVLRAIRFLPSVTDAMWEQVVIGAVSESQVTGLMATETWLKVVQSQPELVTVEDLSKIESALGRDPKPILRLRKNYWLILGEHNSKITIDDVDKQDGLAQNVQDIIKDDGINSLFDYHEPGILAREYYSGHRADDGFYHPSSP